MSFDEDRRKWLASAGAGAALAALFGRNANAQPIPGGGSSLILGTTSGTALPGNYGGISDPTNSFGLGPAAIVRGTVYGHLVTGVTSGTGKTLSVRQATVAALNLAIACAVTNGFRFTIANNTYEIDNTTGVVIPLGNSFVWDASNGVVFVQFHANAPIVSIGDFTNSNATCFGCQINGFTASYGIDQTGNTGAVAIQIGSMAYSVLENFQALSSYSGGTPSNTPYYGLYITSGTSNTGNFFTNVVSNIKVSGAQQSLWYLAINGEGNLYQNIFINQGSGLTPGGLASHPMNIASPNFAGNSDDVYVGVHLDFIRVPANSFLVNIGSAVNIQFTGVHIEECACSGFGMFQISDASIIINGITFLNLHSRTAESAASGLAVFYLFGRSALTIQGLAFEWGGTGYMNTAGYAYIFQAAAGDSQPKINCTTWSFFPSTDNEGQYFTALDNNTSGWSVPALMGTYQFDSVASRMTEAQLTVSTNYTHYGQWLYANVITPAALSGNITVNLSNKMHASGAGSTAATNPIPAGNTIHFRRSSGSVANNLVIQNNGGALATNSTAGVDLYYRFDGTNWVAFT